MNVALSDLQHIASQKGLFLLSCLSKQEAEFTLQKNKIYLENWQDNGYAADMHYMQRSSSLLCEPKNLLDSFQTILTFLVPYNLSKTQAFESRSGFGKVARYAWGNDYHLVIKERLSDFVLQCEEKNFFSKGMTRVFTDSVPLLERALAESSRLGFIGKSSMLIKPGSGTYFFIAEIITSAKINDDLNLSSEERRAYSCGGCRSCIAHCPTNAIVEDKVVNANRCISYLTIEKRGVLSIAEMEQVGDWIFGCDICQEVCPFNNKKAISDNSGTDLFRRETLHGPYLNLREILEISSNEHFYKIFHRSAIKRTKREGLLRNAMVVLYNQKNLSHLDKIMNIMETDISEIVRAQARIVLENIIPYTDGIQRNKIVKSLHRQEV